MSIHSFLKKGSLPITGAQVIVNIEDQDGDVVKQQLFDNGGSADLKKNDG